MNDGITQPRDPFAVDTQRALDTLKAEWGFAYCLSHHEGLYLARRREGPPVVMSGETPDEIVREMRRDWGEAP